MLLPELWLKQVSIKKTEVVDKNHHPSRDAQVSQSDIYKAKYVDGFTSYLNEVQVFASTFWNQTALG